MTVKIGAALHFCVFCFILFLPLSGAMAQMHPYLFYTHDRIEHLKDRIQKDTTLKRQWLDMLSEAESALVKNSPSSEETLAFAYQMTGDRRFAEKAKQGLENLCKKTAWDGMDDRTPRWNAGLGTAHTNFLASLLFDALYPSFTEKERKYFADRIYELGIKPTLSDWLDPLRRIQSLNNMGHNWWSAIVFDGGISCLAVMKELPQAKIWAKEIMKISDEWFTFSGSVLDHKPRSFDQDGGYYESVSYANYGISEYLFFRLAWTHALGSIKMPYDHLLQNTMDWFIEASYPTRTDSLYSLNFGDSNDFANGERCAKLLIALGLGRPQYDWYLDRTRTNRIFKEGLHDSTPLGLLYEQEAHPTMQTPQLPVSKAYYDMGWAMLRDSWKPNASFLAVKSGFTWNHAHADAGSFVLYHNGENLLIDAGDVSYGKPAYSDYFVTSRAHNVLMFNGMAQDSTDHYYAVKEPGHIYNLLDAGKLKFVLSDAMGPTSHYFSRNYRSFLWIDKVILIIDDAKTYETGKFDFLLHYADTAVKKGGDLEITKGKSRILFRPLFPETLPLGYPQDFPEKLKLSFSYGLKDHHDDQTMPYAVLSSPESANSIKFVNAIILLDSTMTEKSLYSGSSGATSSSGWNGIPKIERFENPDYLEVKITDRGVVTQVYLNLLADGRLMHRNSCISVDGFETDAYLFSVSYPEDAGFSLARLCAFFVANGSYLRTKDQVLFSSLSKVFLSADYTHSGTLKVFMQGQPVIRGGIFSQNAKHLLVNDKESLRSPLAGNCLEISQGSFQ